MTSEAPTRKVVYERPYLYPKQEAALFHPARWGVVEASTKSGKTVGCLCWLTELAALGGAPGREYWWVAPIVPQTKIAFRREKRFLPDWSYRSNDTERTIELANGATLWFKSAYDPDSLYGEDVHAVVVDEATRCKAAAWTAIRTTLTATGGAARIIGNVKGSKNWAYRLARRAEARMAQGDPDYHHARLTAHDAVDAGIFPPEELEDARESMAEADFRELYLAEAADTDDQFFHVEQLGTVEDYPRDARLARAWDFAVTPDSKRSDPDWTVGVKMAWDGRRVFVVDVVRLRGSPDQVEQLVRRTVKADGRICDQVLEEEKGAAGAMMIQLFKRLLRDVEGAGRVFAAKVSGDKEARAWHYSARLNEGKAAMVQGPWNQEYSDQLDEFPAGDHDDLVDASAHGYNHLVPRTHKPGRSRIPGAA